MIALSITSLRLASRVFGERESHKQLSFCVLLTAASSVVVACARPTMTVWLAPLAPPLCRARMRFATRMWARCAVSLKSKRLATSEFVSAFFRAFDQLSIALLRFVLLWYNVMNIIYFRSAVLHGEDNQVTSDGPHNNKLPICLAV